MKLRLENPKKALQTNLISRQQAAIYDQMEASWAAGHTPHKSFQITELVSRLSQLKSRMKQPVQKAICDCQSICDCQTACECA